MSSSQRLPIKLDSTSNGEFEPIPLEPVNEFANQLAHEAADRNSRRLNMARRQFLVSSTGAAATLPAFNTAYAMNGRRGGYFELDADAGVDRDAAADALNEQEFHDFILAQRLLPPDLMAKAVEQEFV